MTKPRTLSHRIEAIDYIHADDGLPYRHKFSHGGGTIMLKPDGTIAVKNRDRKLWDLFSVKGNVQPFLVNPPAGRTTTTTRGKPMAKKRRMTALQRKYFGGKRKSNPVRKRKSVAVARRRRSNPPNPVGKRRRRRRSNPMGVNVNSLLKRLQDGGLNALAIVAGKGGIRAISKQLKYPAGSVMDSVVQVGGALGLGLLAERLLGGDRGRFVLAGALSETIEELIVSAKIPYVSEHLGSSGANTAAVYASADAGRSLAGWQRGQMGEWQGGEPLARLASVNSLPVNATAVYPTS